MELKDGVGCKATKGQQRMIYEAAVRNGVSVFRMTANRVSKYDPQDSRFDLTHPFIGQSKGELIGLTMLSIEVSFDEFMEMIEPKNKQQETMKQEFRVGDRVRIKGGYQGKFNGITGRVTDAYGVIMMVQWIPGSVRHSHGHYSFSHTDVELIQDGLVHGDACKEYTPAQLLYALERAKELGLLSEHQHSDGGWLFYGGTPVYKDGVSRAGDAGSYWSNESKNFMSFSEFMEKMERTPKQEEHPMLAGYRAEIKDGKLAFGCQTVSKETLERVMAFVNSGFAKTEQGEIIGGDYGNKTITVMGNKISFDDVRKAYEWFNKQTK